jgi:hypothetical protein
MAKATPAIDLRAALDEVHVPGGPISKFAAWLSKQPPAIVAQLEDIMRDEVADTGHTKIAKLIATRLGGPEFTSEQIARARAALR